MAYGCRIVKGWSSGRGQLMPCSVSWSLYVPFSPCTTKYIDNIEVIQIRGPPDEFILKWPICLYRKIKYVFFLMKDFHPNEIYILWRYSSYCHVDNWPQPKRYQCITDVVNSFWPNKNLLVKGLFKGHVLHVFFFFSKMGWKWMYDPSTGCIPNTQVPCFCIPSAWMTCWRCILRRHAEKKAQSRQGSKQSRQGSKHNRWTMKFCPF